MRAPFASLAMLVACTADPGADDGEADAFTTADGKADGFAMTEAEALAVMRLANERTLAELKAAGVSSRAARNIVAYRATGQLFDSLAELDAIPYVGPRTAEAMLAAAEVDAQALGRHDVSILVPLHPVNDLPWTAAMPGRGGAVLPRPVFDKIGRSVFREIADVAEYDALRVVGVRFDPCFTVALDSACQAQIRLVFQARGNEGTNDGAVHALYNLSDVDFADVIATLVAIAPPANRAYAPLGISPALRAEGMRGPYATALGALIAKHCGPETLARMTFVTRTGARQAQWELGGFHVKAFAATGFPAAGPIAIVGSTETLQVIGNAGLGGGHRYRVTPDLADPIGTTGLVADDIRTMAAAARRELDAWARAQASPVETVPDTTDCSSCHIAGHISNALGDVDAGLRTADGGPRVLGGSERIADNLRAFGYFGRDPMISIRTANETAAVLRALDR